MTGKNAHPSSSPPCEEYCIAVEDGYEAKHQLCHEAMMPIIGQERKDDW